MEINLTNLASAIKDLKSKGYSRTYAEVMTDKDREELEALDFHVIISKFNDGVLIEY